VRKGESLHSIGQMVRPKGGKLRCCICPDRAPDRLARVFLLVGLLTVASPLDALLGQIGVLGQLLRALVAAVSRIMLCFARYSNAGNKPC
jgi:hypothetical protein